MTTQAVGESWYFYAGEFPYYCKLDPESKIPAKFQGNGPWNSKEEAKEAWEEWLKQQEGKHDVYGYIE